MSGTGKVLNLYVLGSGSYTLQRIFLLQITIHSSGLGNGDEIRNFKLTSKDIVPKAAIDIRDLSHTITFVGSFGSSVIS